MGDPAGEGLAEPERWLRGTEGGWYDAEAERFNGPAERVCITCGFGALKGRLKSLVVREVSG